MRAGWGWAFVAAAAACTTEESSSSSSGAAGDASSEAAASDARADSAPVIPASDGGCDGSVPGLSAGSNAQCAGKQGQPAPGSTGAAPGASCATQEDCQGVCCTCTNDGGATFHSTVSVCGCGNVCASAQEACAFYEKTFQLCQ